MADRLRPERPGARPGHAWWSRRFLDVVESLGLADALRGGRRLVRTDAVVSLRRSDNLVVAMVRDPRGPGDEVHKARIAVRTFDREQWTRIEKALAVKAGHAAALLAGSMPADVERTFTALGLSLFPTGTDDLAMDCSCHDWQRPCAHLAAASYQLAQLLDREPFTLLALRGRERDAFLDGLRARRPRPAPVDDDAGDDAGSGADSERDAGAVLPAEVAEFWHAPSSWPYPAAVEPPPGDPLDSALEQRGPLAVGSIEDLRNLLRPAYAAFMEAHD